MDGILLYEPATNTSTINIQWGSANGVFDGEIIAPGATMTLQDNGGSALVTGLYVGYLTMGTGQLDIENYAAAHPGAPMSTIALLE